MSKEKVLCPECGSDDCEYNICNVCCCTFTTYIDYLMLHHEEKIVVVSHGATHRTGLFFTVNEDLFYE